MAPATITATDYLRAGCMAELPAAPATLFQPTPSFEIVELPQRRSPGPQESLNSDLTLGLLHQVNNVLTGIYFNVEECQEQVPSEHPIGSALDEISDAVRNLHQLLERTVEVNLPHADDDANYHDLNELVSNQLDLMRIVFPKTVSVQLQPADGPLHVFASEHNVRRVLLLLARCVREALPSLHTQLSVELKTRTIRPATVSDRSLSGVVAAVELCVNSDRPLCQEGTDFREVQDFAADLGWKVTSAPALFMPLVNLSE